MSSTRKPWQGNVQQILIGLFLASLIVAAIEATSDYDEECGWNLMGTRVSHYGSGDKDRIRIGRGRCRLDAELTGEIDLSPDNRGIERLAPGSSLVIKQRNRGERRRLDVDRGRNGEPEYTWYVNSLPKPFDDEARDWLEEVLPQVYYTTGLDADGRVDHLYRQGGVDAVLDEMDAAANNHVRRLYLQELLGQCGSDEERLAVIAFARREISSDSALGRVLAALTPRDLESAPVREAWTAALASIDSDWELRKTLMAVLEQDGLSTEIADILLDAARTVSSDHEQAQLLASVAEALPPGQALPASFGRALETIGSDHEHRRALTIALARPGLSEDEAEALLATARQISGDFELSSLLSAFADEYPDERQLPASFFRALQTIDSDEAVRRVLASVLERRGLDRETSVKALEAARSVSSDYELWTFLADFLEVYPRAEALPEEFDRLLETMDSEFERGKVLEALETREAARRLLEPVERDEPEDAPSEPEEEEAVQPDEDAQR